MTPTPDAVHWLAAAVMGVGVCLGTFGTGLWLGRRSWDRRLYALGHADGLAARHRTVGQVDLDCYVAQGEGE